MDKQMMDILVKMQEQMNGMEKRLNERFDAVDKKMDKGFTDINRRIELLNKDTENSFKSVVDVINEKTRNADEAHVETVKDIRYLKHKITEIERDVFLQSPNH